MLKMLNRGVEFAAVEFGDADVIVILGGTEYGSIFLLNRFFRSRDQNFGTLLDLLFLRVLRNEILETANCFFKLFGMHQFDSRFVGVDRTLEVFRPRSFRRSRP